mmetsp:Transcript_73907/g.153998  ORF Transcript_73907/g.153998 Transcript_73907/m.153998 type:complete len:584 (+) Transcript_73907:115-1866(+)
MASPSSSSSSSSQSPSPAQPDGPKPEVSTSYGRVAGVSRDGCYHFRGIPYASKPERFKKPTPPEPWEGVRDCSRYGKMALQPQPKAWSLETLKFLLLRVTGILPMHPPEFEISPEKMDEDCLFLNITTPSTEGKRPVMLWIHGGAFIFGSGHDIMYRSAKFSEQQDIVYVTINYRLGCFGFLKVDGGDANCGSWDQLEALKWVHKEIAAFGGDPDNITIMGQSAGGMSTGVLLASPLSQPYFKRAILMSGAMSNVKPAEDAKALAEKVASILKCEPTAEALRQRSALELVTATMQTNSPLPFQPCIDGELVPDLPLRTVSSGLVDLKQKEVMIGCTSEEFNLFKPVNISFSRKPLDALVKLSASHLGPKRMGVFSDACAEGQAQTEEHVRDMMKKLRQAKGMGSWSEVEKEFSNLLIFLVPSRLAARTLAKAGCPVYLYSVDYNAGRLGAAHAMELPLLFSAHNKNRLLKELSGAQKDPRSSEQVSQWMIATFCRFVRCGEPTLPEGHPSEVDVKEQALLSLPTWPVYRPDSTPYVFVFHRECKLEREHPKSVLSQCTDLLERVRRPYGILPIEAPAHPAAKL